MGIRVCAVLDLYVDFPPHERFIPRVDRLMSSVSVPVFVTRYDGVRAQVHLMPDGSLRFFSRSSKDSSSELPDLIPVMKVCHSIPSRPVPSHIIVRHAVCAP